MTEYVAYILKLKYFSYAWRGLQGLETYMGNENYKLNFAARKKNLDSILVQTKKIEPNKIESHTYILSA